MSGIDKIVAACDAVGLLGLGDQYVLSLRDRPLASLQDPGRCTGVLAQFGTPDSVMELLGGLLAISPTGLLVVSEGSQGVALRVRGGRLTGACETGARSDARAWAEAHTRQRAALGDVGPINGRCAYVVELALAGLATYASVHSSVLMLQGDFNWIDLELELDVAPSLAGLMLEYARRSDELPRLIRRVGSLEQLVFGVRRPPEALTAPAKSASDSASDWDFFHEPDPAAVSEWVDARQLFDCCEGLWTVRELLERSHLGKFRTLAATVALLEREHITLAESATSLPDATSAVRNKAA